MNECRSTFCFHVTSALPPRVSESCETWPWCFATTRAIMRGAIAEPASEIVCDRDEAARSRLCLVRSNLDKARPPRHVCPFEPQNLFRAQPGKRSQGKTRRDFWRRVLQQRGHFLGREDFNRRALFLPPFHAARVNRLLSRASRRFLRKSTKSLQRAEKIVKAARAQA